MGTQRRLPAACFHVLLALGDRDRHGLGIMEEVERRTDGRVVLGPGSLYGSIKRLVADGFVIATDPPREGDGGDPRRRYYALTPAGSAALHDELETVALIMEAARAKNLIAERR